MTGQDGNIVLCGSNSYEKSIILMKSLQASQRQ